METATDRSSEGLRARMVARILAKQRLTPAVEAALRRVERHRYVPRASVTDAYDEKAVITHTSPEGVHLSCASGPSIVAAMLDALDVRAGQRILEIGAGTGYNAALLTTLAGPEGEVTTIDVNPDVTAAARRNLDHTGFHRVRVLTGDGAKGAPEHGPYDRIIVTVGAWDLPPAWWDQLAPGGRLVVPLRWRGTTRAVGFTRGLDRWEGDWIFLCGFVPMVGQPGEQRATIDPGGLVALHYDVDQPIDVPDLQGVLGRERAAAVRRCDHSSGRWQLGAIGHGQFGEELAAKIVEQVNVWDRQRTADPDLIAFPAGVPLPDGLEGKVIIKPHSRLVISYEGR